MAIISCVPYLSRMMSFQAFFFILHFLVLIHEASLLQFSLLVQIEVQQFLCAFVSEYSYFLVLVLFDLTCYISWNYI